MTGQPLPLITTFEALRQRAIETPVLDDNLDNLNLDAVLDRHTKAIDFSGGFILGITIIAILRDKHFYWYVQSLFVSKKSGKNIKLNLLTRKEKEALSNCYEWAMEKAGVQLEAKRIHIKDGYAWETPFSQEDYERLNPAFRDLTFLGDEK